jgi:hypothetical protein
MWQGKDVGLELCYRVEQNALFCAMLLDTPGEAHVFEMGNNFRNAHTPRLIIFQATSKELLSKLTGVLRLIFDERQELQFTLVMMLTNLSRTPGEIGKWLAVSW